MYDQLYREARLRVTDQVGALDGTELAITVPACPLWTVQDVLAHLTGCAVAFATGDLEGAATPEWTARQVSERRGRTVSELVAEWEASAPAVEATPSGSRLWFPILHDVLSHESDIRGALGAPRLPADVLAAAFGLLADRIEPRLGGLGPLRIDLDYQVVEVGDMPPRLDVRADLFEFWRGWFGRRSPAQMRAWVLAGDAEAFAAALPVFPVRLTDLVEPAA